MMGLVFAGEDDLRSPLAAAGDCVGVVVVAGGEDDLRCGGADLRSSFSLPDLEDGRSSRRERTLASYGLKASLAGAGGVELTGLVDGLPEAVVEAAAEGLLRFWVDSCEDGLWLFFDGRSMDSGFAGGPSAPI